MLLLHDGQVGAALWVKQCSYPSRGCDLLTSLRHHETRKVRTVLKHPSSSVCASFSAARANGIRVVASGRLAQEYTCADGPAEPHARASSGMLHESVHSTCMLKLHLGSVAAALHCQCYFGGLRFASLATARFAAGFFAGGGFVSAAGLRPMVSAAKADGHTSETVHVAQSGFRAKQTRVP
jgi:hypothetical protein